jgi:transcriptional regulator with XRE-family HTH domain
MPQKRSDRHTRAFSLMLRIHRRRKGWDIIKLAGKIGLSRSAVSAYENHKCAPSFGNMVKIAEAFGITLTQMMELTEKIVKNLEIIDAEAAKAATPAADPKGKSLGASGD